MRYVSCLICSFLLFASAHAWAAPLGISGKWELQGNGQTLLIDEQALTIFLGDRPMGYIVEESDGAELKARLVRDGIPFGEMRIVKKSDAIMLFERAGVVQLYLRQGADLSAPPRPIEGRWTSNEPNRIVTFDFDTREVTLSLPNLPKPEALSLGFTPLLENEEGFFIYVAGSKRGFTWLTPDFLLMCDAVPAGDDPRNLRLDRRRCLFMEPEH